LFNPAIPRFHPSGILIFKKPLQICAPLIISSAKYFERPGRIREISILSAIYVPELGLDHSSAVCLSSCAILNSSMSSSKANIKPSFLLNNTYIWYFGNLSSICYVRTRVPASNAGAIPLQRA